MTLLEDPLLLLTLDTAAGRVDQLKQFFRDAPNHVRRLGAALTLILSLSSNTLASARDWLARTLNNVNVHSSGFAWILDFPPCHLLHSCSPISVFGVTALIRDSHTKHRYILACQAWIGILVSRPCVVQWISRLFDKLIRVPSRNKGRIERSSAFACVTYVTVNALFSSAWELVSDIMKLSTCRLEMPVSTRFVFFFLSEQQWSIRVIRRQ